MKNDVLEKMQKLIELAEILSVSIPEDLLTEKWVGTIVDDANSELQKIAGYLQSEYDIDISAVMDDIESDEYLDSDEEMHKLQSDWDILDEEDDN